MHPVTERCLWMMGLGSIPTALTVAFVKSTPSEPVIWFNVATGFIAFAGLVTLLKPSTFRLRKIDRRLNDLTKSGPWDRISNDMGGMALNQESKQVVLIDASGKGGVFDANQIKGYQWGGRPSARDRNKTVFHLDVDTNDFEMASFRLWFGRDESKLRLYMGKLAVLSDLN